MTFFNRHNISQSFLTAKNGLKSLFFPNLCEICGGEMSAGENHICHYCLSHLNYTLFENYTTDTPVHEVFYGRVNITFAFSLVYFKKNTAIQDLLHQIKYNHGHELAVKMGEDIAIKLQKNTHFLTVDALVPIPLHRKKEAIRGYNQSLKIAEGVCKTSHCSIIHLLSRTKHHESQTKKDRFGRWENVENIFQVEHDQVPPKHIALVDDVITTGSTLEAAARVIRKSYPSIQISIITIAFAQ